MPEADLTAGLARYFALREEQRQQEITEALPQLEERMCAFLAERAEDPELPRILALMIRETAVQARTRGHWEAGGKREGIQPDSVVLWDTLHYCREFDDLCPAWRIFDGRHLEETEDDDA